ncbi:MAG: tRNA preQ1(34) S-adenosylmethionine ribosyltransferase-isomerase QueA [Victivallaceae bacterium]|nr:tRNA preQ1(34) S-adenosylmethionine ribosyltransferase-isomerase QueA [Victivallaceae bacterium]
MTLSTALFDYNLPPELVAQHPAARRDGSRMMTLNRLTGETEILPFPAIMDFLSPGDAMVSNDTKVMSCRLYGLKNGDMAGARFEALQIELVPGSGGARWKAFLKPGKRAKAGTRVRLLNLEGELCDHWYTVIGRLEDEAFAIEFDTADYESVQRECGHMPLPPYIRREADGEDLERYQTVFAKYSGAVAAPTAGLHFTPEILERLSAKGVNRATLTLHVGPGTFKPVSVDDVSKHVMHSEHYILPPSVADLVNTTRRNGRKVLAVGTTTVRVLESCVQNGGVAAGSGATDIFLYPPYRPAAVDMLLTNFHLPKSTLLMLVSCFCEREMVLAAYRKAVEAEMRFYSYGDCMLLY